MVKRGAKGDATVLQPTILFCVPLILDRIYKVCPRAATSSDRPWPGRDGADPQEGRHGGQRAGLLHPVQDSVQQAGRAHPHPGQAGLQQVATVGPNIARPCCPASGPC